MQVFLIKSSQLGSKHISNSFQIVALSEGVKITGFKVCL